MAPSIKETTTAEHIKGSGSHGPRIQRARDQVTSSWDTDNAQGVKPRAEHRYCGCTSDFGENTSL